MIPDKDIRFVQQKAFKLLSEGKSIEAIKQLIADEGGDDTQIQTLASKYTADYDFLVNHEKKQAKKDAPLDLWVGGFLLFGGLLVSILSYIFLDHVYFLLYGAIIAGGVMFVRALIAQNTD
jgi:hypothetical protein